MTLRTIGCLVIFTFGLYCMPGSSRAACGKGAPCRLSERGRRLPRPSRYFGNSSTTWAIKMARVWSSRHAGPRVR